MFSPSQIDSINPDIFVEKKVFDYRHLNLVIPAAGEGSRFFKAGWKKPKPFLDIGGKSMLQLVSENLTFGENKPLIICRSEDLDNSKEDITKLKRFGAKFVYLKNVTGGTAITILAARNHLDETQPLLVGNSDQLIDFDVEKFVNDCIERNLDGSILVFKDIKKDPKWSYAALDENNLVSKVA
jgi:NDP-sugar pyrophosphorylase family protein